MNLLKKFSGASFIAGDFGTPALASVTVSLPVNGTVVSSPFLLSANASTARLRLLAQWAIRSIAARIRPSFIVGGAGRSHGYGGRTYAARQGVGQSRGRVRHRCRYHCYGHNHLSQWADGISVTSPTNGAAVTSPFDLSAAASTCSSQPVGAIGYSLDNSTNTTIVNGTSLNVQVTAAAGAHTLYVLAWGYQGASCTQTSPLRSRVPRAAGPVVPPNAIEREQHPGPEQLDGKSTTPPETAAQPEP